MEGVVTAGIRGKACRPTCVLILDAGNELDEVVIYLATDGGAAQVSDTGAKNRDAGEEQVGGRLRGAGGAGREGRLES